MKELGYDVIGRQEGRMLIKRDELRRKAMNSSIRRNLAIAGSISLIVIILIVGALRAKHASGAGREAPGPGRGLVRPPQRHRWGRGLSRSLCACRAVLVPGSRTRDQKRAGEIVPTLTLS